MGGSLSPSERSNPFLDDSSGVVRFVREQPPENCILKVELFSALQETLVKSKIECINSTEFKAGGYNWVLRVYPSGNKQEGGDGHLSLSVSLTDKLHSGTSLNVALRFFVHDQLRDNYLTVLDIRDKCFNALKTTWGIAKVMPLESFTDVSNGFLVDDSCVFGAEVLLREDLIKRSTMSLLKSHSDRIYTWKINNFSDLSNHLYSPTFTFGEWFWKLLLYPRGSGVGKGKYLSLFLYLDNANDLSHGKNLYTKACLCVKNQGKGEDHSRIVYTSFHSECGNWGYASFLSISDVYNTSKSFLVNDTLIVEVKIDVMFIIKSLKDSEPTLKNENKSLKDSEPTVKKENKSLKDSKPTLQKNERVHDNKYAVKSSSVRDFFSFFKQCVSSKQHTD